MVATTFPEAMTKLEQWAQSPDKAYGVAYADVHVMARARHEADFGSALKKLDAVMPDGRPVLWAVNQHLPKDLRLTQRISGPDMFSRFQAYSNERPHLRHFYLGGSEQLLGDLIDSVKSKCPSINIAGAYSPPFGTWSAEEISLMIQKISDSGANVVWVGLGCPKQEKWIADNLPQLPPGVYMAVGAAFAFYTGKVKRAPIWMQKLGMEWCHRILSEPRRLWKRYVVYNSLFLYYTLRDRCCGTPKRS